MVRVPAPQQLGGNKGWHTHAKLRQNKRGHLHMHRILVRKEARSLISETPATSPENLIKKLSNLEP